MLTELGTASWHAPPMGSRALDAYAVRIGAKPPRDSGVADVSFVVPLHPSGSVSRFEIANHDWPDSTRRFIHYLPPALYQFRITYSDGTRYESYASIRCQRQSADGHCQQHRSFIKPWQP